MAIEVKRRRGTTAEHATFTGAVGELTVDATKDTVVVHDGVQAGGYPLMREDLSNASTISAFAKTVLDDISAPAVLTTLGVSPYAQTILDDANATQVLTTLGVSAFIQTLLNDADAATARNTLGALVREVGEVAAFAMSTPPSGWLECNGTAISRTTYASLYTAIGTTYGIGDGTTTFNLPDLRGEFIRGYDNGRGVDAGRVFGSAQADEYESHNHRTGFVGSTRGNTSGIAGGYLKVNTADLTTSSVHADSFPNSGGTETRPRNIAMMYCIKY